MKQKILIILNGIFGDTPHISGGDVRPLEMMRYWHKKGFEIHILSSEKIDRYVENSTSVILHLQPSLSLSNTKWQYIVRAIQSLWLPSSLKKESFDVVYSSNDTLFDVIPGWLLKPVVQPLALHVFAQDAKILALQTENAERFGASAYVSTEVDLLGPHILRLLQRAAAGDTGGEPYQTEVEMDV